MSTFCNRSARWGQDDKGKTGKMSQKSKSFHGQTSAREVPLRRPKTQPDLHSGRTMSDSIVPPRPTKLLLNVTVQRSLGAVQLLMSPEATVGDLVREVVREYRREGRRPLLPSTEPDRFDLHYSQFSLECLDPKEKLIGLGSRNFFLCPKPITAPSSTSCSTEADKASKTGFSWLRLMNFFP